MVSSECELILLDACATWHFKTLSFFKIEPIFCFLYLHTNDQLLLLAGFCHPTLVCSVEMYCFTLTNYVCTPAPHFHSQLSTVCTAGYIDFFFLSFFSACHVSTFSSLFKLNWGWVMWKWLVLLEWCPNFWMQRITCMQERVIYCSSQHLEVGERSWFWRVEANQWNCARLNSS